MPTNTIHRADDDIALGITAAGYNIPPARQDELNPVRLSFYLALTDGLLVCAAGALSCLAAFGSLYLVGPFHYLVVGGAAIAFVIISGEHGLYDLRTVLAHPQPNRQTALCWLAAAGLVVLGAALLRVVMAESPVPDDASGDVLSPERWLVLLLAISLALLVAARLAFNPYLRSIASAGAVATRVALLGSGDKLRALTESLEREPAIAIRVVAILATGEGAAGKPGPTADALTQELDILVSAIGRSEIDMVVIALPERQRDGVAAAIARLAATPVDIRLMPDLALQDGAIVRPGTTISDVAGVPLLNVRDRPLSSWSRVVKRLEDLLVTLLVLLLVGPLLLVVAVAIKLDSPGPVLFRQRRYGFNNNLISVLKFRTMRSDDADPDCERQTVRGDARITRVGAVLRKLSIDELPQFVNVLRGEMSVVGPRPHAVATKAAGRLFEEVAAGYAARHRVKPGITGWAQVNGWRGETDTVEKLQKRVEYDLYYIKNWSLMFDLHIILRTLGCVVDSRNAY